MMLFSVLARLGVTAWLTCMAYLDMRRRELPHWGTTIPLVVLACLRTSYAVGAWASPSGGWAPAVADGLAIGLAFAAVLLSDHRWWAFAPAAGALALAFARGSSAGQTVAVTWLVVLALAKAGIVGEGDAKVAMILVVLYPDPLLGVCLLAACVPGGVIALAARMKGAAPVLLRLTLRDALALRFPVRTGDKGVVVIPLTPVLALGALVYMWLLWLVH